MKNPIRTPAASPEITAQKIPVFSGRIVYTSTAAPIAARILETYVPFLSDASKLRCVAFSFVFTKKVPIIEAIIPIAAISIGVITPFKPSPAAEARAPQEKIEPTYDS